MYKHGKAPKVYQLLLLLIASGGKNIPTHDICDTIWSCQEADYAMQNLEFILRKLRQTLQKYLPQNLRANQIIQLQHGKISLNQQYCTLDTWCFEELQHQAKALRLQREDQQAYAIEKTIQHIIQGSFLPGEAEMISSHRHAWHNRLCNWLDTTISHWKHDEHIHFSEIMDLLDIGLDIDPYSERLLCHRIQLLHQAGYQNDAVRYYQDWASLLFQQFKLKPSPIAQQAYQKLQATG